LLLQSVWLNRRATGVVMTEQDFHAVGPSRSKWRRIVDFPLMAMLIAVALFILAVTAANLIARVLPPSSTIEGLALRAAVYIALACAVYKLVIVRLGDRPRDDLQLRDAAPSLFIGCVLGFFLFCALAGIAALFDVYNVLGWNGAGELPRDLILIGILPAFMEELFFRGILFRWIEELGGTWTAFAVTSALFGAGHAFNPGATLASSFATMIGAGVLLGSVYVLARNLWAPIGLHGAWNFTQGFVFGAPVSGKVVHGLVQADVSGPILLSGGAFGLEASMIVVVLAIPLGAGLMMLARKRGELIEPWWIRRAAVKRDHVATSMS
jgi:membrane protease YdiL (CAAX protease family)